MTIPDHEPDDRAQITALLESTDPLGAAVHYIAKRSVEDSRGKWLEHLTAGFAPLIRDWDVAECHTWSDWPDRARLLPETTNQDIAMRPPSDWRTATASIPIS